MHKAYADGGSAPHNDRDMLGPRPSRPSTAWLRKAMGGGSSESDGSRLLGGGNGGGGGKPGLRSGRVSGYDDVEGGPGDDPGGASVASVAAEAADKEGEDAAKRPARRSFFGGFGGKRLSSSVQVDPMGKLPLGADLATYSTKEITDGFAIEDDNDDAGGTAAAREEQSRLANEREEADRAEKAATKKAAEEERAEAKRTAEAARVAAAEAKQKAKDEAAAAKAEENAAKAAAKAAAAEEKAKAAEAKAAAKAAAAEERAAAKKAAADKKAAAKAKERARASLELAIKRAELIDSPADEDVENLSSAIVCSEENGLDELVISAARRKLRDLESRAVDAKKTATRSELATSLHAIERASKGVAKGVKDLGAMKLLVSSPTQPPSPQNLLQSSLQLDLRTGHRCSNQSCAPICCHFPPPQPPHLGG